MQSETDRHLQRDGTTPRVFNLVISREGDAARITVSGELDIGSADELDRAIRDVEESEIGAIVVDLSDLSFMDSTGLSVLLRASKRARGEGDRLRFLQSQHDSVTRLLELTGTRELLD
jgi:anti-sigma B factor antagonist